MEKFKCDFCDKEVSEVWELPECVIHGNCELDKPDCQRHANKACKSCASELEK